MALIAKSKLDVTGMTAAPAAASPGGDTILNDQPNAIFYVTNIGGVSRNVTIDDPNSVPPAGAVAFNPDVTFAVPAGAGRFFPLYGRFTNPTTGLVNVSYSDSAGLVVAVMYI